MQNNGINVHVHVTISVCIQDMRSRSVSWGGGGLKGFRHEGLETSEYKWYVHGSIKYLAVELDHEVEQEHELSGRRVNKNKITHTILWIYMLPFEYEFKCHNICIPT